MLRDPALGHKPELVCKQKVKCGAMETLQSPPGLGTDPVSTGGSFFFLPGFQRPERHWRDCTSASTSLQPSSEGCCGLGWFFTQMGFLLLLLPLLLEGQYLQLVFELRESLRTRCLQQITLLHERPACHGIPLPGSLEASGA